MNTKTLPFDAAVHITTNDDQAVLLTDALESGHAAYVTNALGIIARARGMMLGLRLVAVGKNENLPV